MASKKPRGSREHASPNLIYYPLSTNLIYYICMCDAWHQKQTAREQGKEAVVLTAEYTDEDAEEHHVEEGDGSVAVLVSLMVSLSRVPWLSKDVIFVATPKSARRHEAVQAWLRDYHAYHSTMIRSGTWAVGWRKAAGHAQ